ncbi:GNAT family N-acetyltransferase [Pseudooceanicola nanhaiensis]|uniref:GNAT family N-acetyltransferase n=1 Tax=Pseudooceanicola nanhaiensis TaxID=375761 RepID=UPI0040587C66
MIPSVTLRPYEARDAFALADIYRKGVARLGPRAYRAEQVAAWLSIAPSAQDLDRIYRDGRFTRVALDQSGAPIGFGDLASTGHIHFLYVDPDFAGQGIGRALIAEFLREARRQSLDTVFSDASELARPVLLRAGFKCIARQEREIGGIHIHNYHVCFAVPERERALSQARGRTDGDT